MQELKGSHAEHDAEVRRLSKEMPRMKRRAREQGGPMKIGEPQRTIARVLVCMNNGDPTAAIEYVSRSRASPTPAALPENKDPSLMKFFRTNKNYEINTNFP